MTDEADRSRAAARAQALLAQARAGGLRFEAYLPSGLATWIVDKIARGEFGSPSDAVFALLGEQQQLELHADLRQEVLRRALRTAVDDPRPTLPADGVWQRWQQRRDAALLHGSA